mmetsp:Transcript_64405/g.153623  ORF Transcript_64405/g.153623 Transcript_64405/m.153623 type:complete len:203 (-) Transcript_64405:662-1270(-)
MHGDELRCGNAQPACHQREVHLQRRALLRCSGQISGPQSLRDILSWWPRLVIIDPTLPIFMCLGCGIPSSMNKAAMRWSLQLEDGIDWLGLIPELELDLLLLTRHPSTVLVAINFANVPAFVWAFDLKGDSNIGDMWGQQLLSLKPTVLKRILGRVPRPHSALRFAPLHHHGPSAIVVRRRHSQAHWRRHSNDQGYVSLAAV